MEYAADVLTRRGDTFLVEELLDLIAGWDPEFPPPADWRDGGDRPYAGPAVMDLDAELSDRLVFLVAELVERFAPNVALHLERRRVFDDVAIGDTTAGIDQAIAALAQRHAARLLARASRQGRGSGEDA